MGMLRTGFSLSLVIGLSTFFIRLSVAQAPARPPAPASAKGAALAGQIDANLRQLMRGIYYPNSNVIFFGQSHNPADVKPAADPATATDPLMTTYGKWEALENSGLAIAEGARLLNIPGRKCANGLDVPIKNTDWPKFVQGLREAGLAAYKAAQSKDMDKILDASDTLATACSNCHEKYRDKGTLADRCK